MKKTPLECPIQKTLETIHKKLSQDCSGTVASYIPELSKANPDWFGACIVTADGRIYEVGDTRQEFTIQSISKPFVYGMALEDSGLATVLDKVWVEPSGEAFNAISLRPERGQPDNPMINAGAIATTSLVHGPPKQKLQRVLDGIGRYAGRQLSIDQSVFRSESATGDRNRAIAYMLRNFSIIETDPVPVLETYFAQCAISVNCRDLAIMAATLANRGENPVTGMRAIVREHVPRVLSVMGSCGMYDAAGEWIYHVGMPAKSGVAGGIVAVLPGQLGIGVFSPPLDACGNSVRGVRFCRELSAALSLHMFNATRTSTSTLRRVSYVGEIFSNRLRTPAEREILRRFGNRAAIMELQGAVTFASSEIVIRDIMDNAETLDGIVMDFGHVQSIDYVSCGLIVRLIQTLTRSKRFVFLSQIDHLPRLVKAVTKDLPRLPFFHDRDLALENAENRVLTLNGHLRTSSHRVRLEDCEALQGLSKKEISIVRRLLVLRTYTKGQKIITSGMPSQEMLFLIRGSASVWLVREGRPSRRIATFAPGMTLGEMGLLDGKPRSADVSADSNVEVMVMDAQSFELLCNSHPLLHSHILKNLAYTLARRLREANLNLAVG